MSITSSRTLRHCVAAAFALLTCSAIAKPLQTLDDATRKQIDGITSKALKATGAPSASVAIVIDGKLAYQHAYGNATLHPDKAAVPAMRYGIGSISKQFLAAAMLILQSEGKLSLDDKASKYLPDLGPAGEATLRQLLSHTAGIRDYWPQDFVFADMLQPVTEEEIIQRWARQPLDFPVGERWQYSNTGYVLAGAVLEKVAGESVFSFLQHRVLTPLQMNTAVNVDTQELDATDASGYTAYALGPLQPAPKSAPGWLSSMGELAMTAGDLAKWDVSLIDQSLLTKDAYQQLEREVLLNNGAGSKYGLGMDVTLKNEHRVLEHGGEISGFISNNVVLPDDRIAIVVLTNSDTSEAASTISHDIEDALLAAEVNDPRTQATMKTILQNLQQGKFDRTLFSKNGNAYFTDAVIHETAHQLTLLGKIKSFKAKRSSTRGGMETRVYDAEMAHKKLTVITRTWIDGGIEQYTLEKE